MALIHAGGNTYLGPNTELTSHVKAWRQCSRRSSSTFTDQVSTVRMNMWSLTACTPPTGGALGRRPRDDGIKGKKCPEFGLAGLVFTEVVQREVHVQRIDYVYLLAVKGVHASSQTSQVVIACEDGADTRDEDRRGRCRRRAGNTWLRQAKEKPTGERTVTE